MHMCVCVAFYLVIGIAYCIIVSSCVGSTQSIYFFLNETEIFHCPSSIFFGVFSAVCRISIKINQSFYIHTHAHICRFLNFQESLFAHFFFSFKRAQTKPKNALNAMNFKMRRHSHKTQYANAWRGAY